MDILITRGKHRAHIIGKTTKGSDWITVYMSPEGTDGTSVWVGIDPSLVDEMEASLTEAGLEVEVR